MSATELGIGNATANTSEKYEKAPCLSDLAQNHKTPPQVAPDGPECMRFPTKMTLAGVHTRSAWLGRSCTDECASLSRTMAAADAGHEVFPYATRA